MRDGIWESINVLNFTCALFRVAAVISLALNGGHHNVSIVSMNHAEME
jgi:hypothetical protein